MDIKKAEDVFTTGIYSKKPVAIVKGKGSYMYDEKGKKYLDCTAAYGTANMGHSNPEVAKAICAQSKKIIACNEIWHNDMRAKLMGKLVKLAPKKLNKVFLCNSGTEAVEAALKFARVATKRTGLVAAEMGFHGRTMGALSATWKKEYREYFEPLVPGVEHIPFNDAIALDEKITDKTAALIIEIVQGEGGVRVASKEFLETAQRVCNETGALLIVDEIQTGFGRTGKMFALEHFGIEPDILCLAKSMGNGFPVGATLIKEGIAKELPKASHGSTFGGNPLACAASLAAINFLEKKKLVKAAEKKGKMLMAGLEKLAKEKKVIKEVRGLGLMVGIELYGKAEPYIEKLMKEGLFVLQAGPEVIRLLPPLTIGEAELKTVLKKLEKVL